MTQSLYEAVLTVSDLQRKYTCKIEIIILTRDYSQYKLISTATEIKIKSERDRSTNETIKFGNLRLDDQTTKKIQTRITQTAVIHLVSASKSGCTIFGITLASTTKSSLQLTVSTSFDDISSTLNLGSIDLSKYHFHSPGDSPSLHGSDTPVTYQDVELPLFKSFEQFQFTPSPSHLVNDLITTLEDDFISNISQNIQLEKELSSMIANPDTKPRSRLSITRPQTERWFILLSKLVLPKMENWDFPIDQQFIKTCQTCFTKQDQSFNYTIRQLLIVAMNLTNNSQPLDILKIVLGLHTQTELLLIQKNEPHQCSFLVSCPFDYISRFFFDGKSDVNSFYKFYLHTVAVQTYSKYGNTQLEQMDQSCSTFS